MGPLSSSYEILPYPKNIGDTRLGIGASARRHTTQIQADLPFFDGHHENSARIVRAKSTRTPEAHKLNIFDDTAKVPDHAITACDRKCW